MAPVLQQAKDAGIKVLTSDTDAPSSVREAFVSQASTEGIGTALVDELAKPMGNKGKYAIVSCGETAQNLNSWIAVQKKVTADKYKDMTIVDTVYAGEDQNKATQMATDLMNAHPDLTGLVGECTSSAPGVAQAVKDAGKIGKVFTVGLGTPQVDGALPPGRLVVGVDPVGRRRTSATSPRGPVCRRPTASPSRRPTTSAPRCRRSRSTAPPRCCCSARR